MNSRKRVLIVGHGAGGLCAALSAAERRRKLAQPFEITVVEQTPPAQAGGGTRFSPSNMRFGPAEQMRREFETLRKEDGRYDQNYLETLADLAEPTIEWLSSFGLRFEQIPYYLAATPRYRPVGGGAALIERLTQSARDAGVELIYDLEAEEIVREGEEIIGLRGTASNGLPAHLPCDSIVLACGGFQGNRNLLREYLGPGAEDLKPISPGSGHNKGAGLKMAVALGAATTGDWGGMHCEPIDPRSENPAPVVLTYPFGIVVDRLGRRFFDEGGGLVHETWEDFARAIHFHAPGRIAYAVLDSRIHNIPDWRRAVRSDVAPVEAGSISGLAERLGIPGDALQNTLSEFNACAPNDEKRFDPSRHDGLATSGLHPPKSNWARPIDCPPYLAYPLICGIAYTFGGLSSDTRARVLSKNGPVPRLYAAGEITGHFYRTAPNAISILRSIVFGRIAGQTSVDDLGYQAGS